MDESLTLWCDAYASQLGARGAWVVDAVDTVDALSRLALVGEGVRLVVFMDDFADKLATAFASCDLVLLDSPDPALFSAAVADGTPSVWFVNTLGGFGWRVADVRALSVSARASGALLVVDNTVASCVGADPLRQGAAVCLEALDRLAAGCAGSGGVAVSAAFDRRGRGRRTVVDPAAARAYEHLVSLELPLPKALDISQLAAGFSSLPARMQARQDTARALASYLAAHPRVAEVCYPGLASHPDHVRASSLLMHGCGIALDFHLDAVSAREFVSSFLEQVPAEPAGGAATRVYALTGRGPSWVRVFCGGEDAIALVDDFERAILQACAMNR